jgi:phosphoglycolate phosphatase
MNLYQGGIEIINPAVRRRPFRAVLFDFDGTLSLIRSGWPQVMIPMMVEILAAMPRAGNHDHLARHVEEFVMRLNGRQTIYQMIQLAEEVKALGGTPRDPLEYKRLYHHLLMERIRDRIDRLQAGADQPADWSVAGAGAMLQRLQEEGAVLYLASGTDLACVQREAELLDLHRYFSGRIFAALDDYWNFSKRMVIERMIEEQHLVGEELLGFGDGFVEIEEVKRVGGVAVGVASDEEGRQGVDSWKRRRLIQAGADVIIPDYACSQELIDWLWGRK